MTVLCIETSTAVCSAAICQERECLKQCISYEGNHAKMLPLFVEELLAFAREKDLKIEAVAVSDGPGSYTGLRIGAATAKGICYGLNIPILPIPTLRILAQAGKERVSQEQEYNTRCVLIPLIDARRMEVYTNGPDNTATAVVVKDEESLLQWKQSLAPYTVDTDDCAVFYFGDGAEKCQSVITRPNWHYWPGVVPEAQYMGKILDDRMADFFMLAKTNLEKKAAYYEPNYLKEFIAAPSHVKGLK